MGVLKAGASQAQPQAAPQPRWHGPPLEPIVLVLEVVGSLLTLGVAPKAPLGADLGGGMRAYLPPRCCDALEGLSLTRESGRKDGNLAQRGLRWRALVRGTCCVRRGCCAGRAGLVASLCMVRLPLSGPVLACWHCFNTPPRCVFLTCVLPATMPVHSAGQHRDGCAVPAGGC